VGGQSSTEILKTLGKGGCHVTYGGMSLKPVISPTSALIFKDISVRGYWMSQWIEDNFNNPARIDMYQKLAEMAANGQLRPPKNSFVPLCDYKEVMDNCMKGFKNGKYIFDLS
jgi:trans-2-enoyl-CoA reductase